MSAPIVHRKPASERRQNLVVRVPPATREHIDALRGTYGSAGRVVEAAVAMLAAAGERAGWFAGTSLQPPTPNH